MGVFVAKGWGGRGRREGGEEEVKHVNQEWKNEIKNIYHVVESCSSSLENSSVRENRV